MTTGPEPPQHLADGEVVAVLLALDRCEVHRAELATQRASSPDVQGFAVRMIAEHASSSRLLEDIAARRNLPLEQSALVDEQQREADSIANALSVESGYEFDCAYIHAEIELHREALALLDETLLPSVGESELGEALATVRASVADHLAHAERIEASLLETRPH